MFLPLPLLLSSNGAASRRRKPPAGPGRRPECTSGRLDPVRRRMWFAFCAALVTAVSASSATAAAALKIKLATLVPTGSVYHKQLLQLREEWRRISNNGVDLVVYADGRLGGEAQVVRLMGLNSVQAAMFSSVGLAEVDPAVEGLQSIPMGFRSFEEVDYVGERVQPTLEKRLADKGFQVLAWSDAGWVRFFSKKPVVRPDDLRKLKIFSWAGSPEQIEVYKSAGFNAVPLETADIVPSLETGLIEVAPSPPVFALAGQIDRRAPYMLEIDWAPLTGAIVVRKAVWDKLPEAWREPMLKAAREVGRQVKALGRKESEEAVKAMEARGLKVTKLTPELAAEWRATAEAAYPKIRGKIVPADAFDETLRLLQEFRTKAGRP